MNSLNHLLKNRKEDSGVYGFPLQVVKSLQTRRWDSGLIYSKCIIIDYF